jgi:lipopolysaccharide heptosyltransferase II
MSINCKFRVLAKLMIMKYQYQMEILFVKLGALGDVINTLPLAVNLKKNLDARITWLVEPLSFPIVDGHPCVDRVILFDRKSWKKSLPDVFNKLRDECFDITLDLQRIFKSACFCMASKSSRRIGFNKDRCKESTWLFPFERIARADAGRHMAIQYLDFARHLGVDALEIKWDIPVSGLIPYNLPDRYVVLNIGATKKANKWPEDNFAKLSEMITGHFGIKSVITGGREDFSSSIAITEKAEDCLINLAGKTTIPELKEIIAGAELIVSCDTGPMHLAVALGKPVLALFGPSDPKRTGPLYGEVIQKRLNCIPCNKRNCDDPRCMRDISPQDVLARMEAVWSA